MATFTVKIDCDNAAFGEDDFEKTLEIERILRRVADRVHKGEGMSCWETILDSNGKDVGRFALKDFQGQGIRKP
jgi:hypothetical protein